MVTVKVAKWALYTCSVCALCNYRNGPAVRWWNNCCYMRLLWIIVNCWSTIINCCIVSSSVTETSLDPGSCQQQLAGKDNTNMHKYTECWKNMHLSYIFRRPCFWHFPLCKNVSFREWWQVEQIAGRCAGCIKTIKYFKTCAQRFDVNNITLKFTMYIKNGPNNIFSFGHFHSFAVMHQIWKLTQRVLENFPQKWKKNIGGTLTNLFFLWKKNS